MNRNNFTLGLDLGIGSLGWSLIDFQNKQIVDGGVVLWNVPQEPKNKKSLCKKRREYRSVRRNLQRKKNRKKECLKLFKEFNLIPNEADASWLQTSKGEIQPYLLRNEALKRCLSKRELCQMLYSICSSRGYIDHGTGGSEEDSEEKKVLSAIKENEKALGEGYRTYTEALLDSAENSQNEHPSWRNHSGDYSHCFSKEMIIHDLGVMFDKQRQLNNKDVTQEFENKFKEILYWEKIDDKYDDLVYSKVGKCVYYPEEKRAAQRSFSNEYLSAWERLSNIRIKTYEGDERSLSQQEVFEFLDILFSSSQLNRNKSCVVKYSMIRKTLNIGDKDHFKSIENEDQEVYKPKGFRKLRESLPSDLMKKLREDRKLCDQLIEVLTYASNESSLKRRLSDFPFNEEEINEIAKLPFNGKIFKGYCARSLKALGELIEVVEKMECKSLSDAEEKTHLKEKRALTKNVFEFLPRYEDTADLSCTNPVVLRCMSNVRKLVNAVIKKHGLPNSIHIEVGRDLKRSKHERKLIEARNKKRNEIKETYANQAAEILGCEKDEVPNKLIRKLALRDQQKQIDLMTGEIINVRDLCLHPYLYEIDHILPYSRTCYDTEDNKQLVSKKTNSDKSNKTPFEFLVDSNSKDQSWIEFKNKIYGMNSLSKKKKQNLLCENLGEKEESYFIKRNLNDTRYASSLAKQWIEDNLSFEDDGKKHVQCNAGGVTAKLRYSWQMGDKNREEDNRHHFVDACIIAACSQGAIQRVANVHKRNFRVYDEDDAKSAKDEYMKALKGTEPWEGFSDDVSAFKNNIHSVRRSSHKVQGSMFEDFLYSFNGFNLNNKVLIYRQVEGKKKDFKPSGNFVLIDEKKGVRLIDEQAFIRLWWDPKFFKKKGKYLVEVVFRADLARLKDRTYVPRFIPKGTEAKHRGMWEKVPERAKVIKPIEIYPGDCVSIGGGVYRYVTTNISSGKIEFKEIDSDVEAKNYPTIKNWNPNDCKPMVISEDILGECFKNLEEER